MASTTDTWSDGKITIANIDGTNGVLTSLSSERPDTVTLTVSTTLYNVGDVNGDGFDDFVSCTPTSNTTICYFGNDGGVNFGFVVEGGTQYDGPDYGLGAGYGFGDFNNDGYSDIFLTYRMGGYWIFGHSKSPSEGDAAANVMTGANGDDVLKGYAGNDTLDGGLRNDVLYGSTGDDTLYGGGGNDRLLGAGGADALFGGDGDDILNGGGGHNTLTGGAGADSYTVGSMYDIVVETDNGGHDTVIARRDYTLTDFVEVLFLRGPALVGTGNDMDNWLNGNGLDNTLTGLAGNDRIWGRGGNDLIDGGDGADRLSGDDGNDDIAGGADGDRLAGGAGDDSLDGGDGGDDLYGGTGNDTLVGGAGVDALFGDGGDDILVIGEGEVALDGGDYAVGGAGADVFRVSTLFDAGQILITDFGDGADTLDLSLVDADTATDGDQAFHWGTIGVDGAGTLARVEIAGFVWGLAGDVDGDGQADLWLNTNGVLIEEASILL